ncbi:mediator of DNA damage checkpoint protein 1 isoform X1 [Neodiprion fabricii]|uniref:mediator of DNA damage checkpoint protein 1 isoform X1 n=1 Tax=Neodiprion fabricii TaxID=2872261 RepID=UPI001ED8F425|nr:mediator of DNA damage checkpoint protein 1 isoform X1 [Neodiprion fabricii]
MEKRKNYIRVKTLLGLLLLAVFVDAESPDPADHFDPESSNVEQESVSSDLHKRQLSPSEQAQILSDVQQHQSRFGRVPNPIQNLQNTSPFPSLAKYKVDRAKQQQELLQLQQQQQRQNSNQQRIQNFFETAQTQYQPQAVKQQQQFQQILQSQPQFSQYQNLPINNAKYLNLNQPLLNNGQNIQLQSYFEKQRQLEFLQKQRERLLAEQQELRRQQELLRLQQLQQLQTTTSTTTPSPFQSTFSPLLLSSPSARKITAAESDLFLKAIASHQKKFSSTTSSPPVATTTTLRTTTVEASPSPTSRATARGKLVNDKQEIPKDILSLIEAQESQGTSSVSQNGKSKPQIQIIYQTEKPTAGATRQKSSAKSKSSQSSAQREALLRQLKLALLQSPDDEAAKNISTRDLVLPNGKTVQVIRAPNSLPSVESQLTSESLKEVVKSSLPTTSIKPPNAILEELTKGVLPPGADFEVLRHKLDGNLEEVGKAPLENSPAKKVTFVVLEEQPDGSYKVQGVKGNADKENGGDVESIVERIKNGELKLPPPSVKPSPTTAIVTETITTTRKPPAITNVPTVITGPPPTTTYRPQTILETGKNTDFSKSSDDRLPFVTISSSGGSATDRYVTSATTPSSHVYNSYRSTSRPSVHQTQSYVSKYPVSTRSHFIPTMAPVNEIVTQYPTTTPLSTSTYAEYTTNRYFSPTTYSNFGSKTAASPSPRSIANTPKTNVVYEENYESSTVFAPTSVLTVTPPPSDLAGDNLTRIFKRQGLYAMAKFLGQSGLDTVLNDTGPYTIFVPTDKAFRALLVQLGGPEKAEEKFRENPRLLSGLLLHHVIPGAFRIDSLQDEMTGVSLAGTQLRVNTYNMQDVEWNDVRVTTINGARVLPDKQNIEIPQGISHAVDRVMFPLPVGDLVETLQADRERRFTVFLRALHASGLEETLSGSKTYTIFAPTDNAFMIASASPNGSPPWLDDEDNQEAARAIVSRHVIPTTLFTAGMRYYQQKETLHSQAFLHIHKNSGRIKVNNAKVISYNIPATNGVIHAVDTLL